ncbi:hypothetical protein H4I96_09320 [Botrytis cinerea]
MSASSNSQTRYKLVYRVLPSHLSATKDAIFAVGGGVYADGKYIKVCFEIPENRTHPYEEVSYEVYKLEDF